MHQILCEQNPLKLNDEEIDELLYIPQHVFEIFSWDCVVFPWTERTGKALGQDGPASYLSGRGYCILC